MVRWPNSLALSSFGAHFDAGVARRAHASRNVSANWVEIDLRQRSHQAFLLSNACEVNLPCLRGNEVASV
jgi:hypothetical protein